MVLKTYPRPGNKPSAQDIQNSIQRYTGQLNTNPLLDGRLITNIQLAAGTQYSLSHGLNRIPKGYIITDIDQAATIYRSATSTRTNLYLTSSAACTISVYVF